jgi:hypothetical protein
VPSFAHESCSQALDNVSGALERRSHSRPGMAARL